MNDYDKLKSERHNNLILFQEPNSVGYTNGKDKVRCDPEIIYEYNSLGLRGPEPNFSASKKILFLGGSFSLGTGVNLKDSFPYIVSKELGVDYINLSPANNLIDLYKPASNLIDDYKPDLIIITETRGFQESEWWLGDIHRLLLKHDPQLAEAYKLSTRAARKDIFHLFFSKIACKNLVVFKSTHHYWNFTNRNTFGDIPILTWDSNDFSDYARDNFHPGPLTNQIISDNFINELLLLEKDGLLTTGFFR